MNRLFKKISVAFAGLAMAVGVGVALGNAKPAVEAKATQTANFTLQPDDNMTATSDQTGLSVGLGTLKWSSAKNDGTANPAINTTNNDFRLYPHYQQGKTLAGNGGSLTFTWSDVIFTQVVVNVSTSPTTKYSIGGGEATTATISQNKFTITGLNSATSLTIQNCNISSTDNIQLRMTSFVFTYETTATQLEITGSNTVASDNPVTYSCQDPNAIWSLTSLNPAGCASINGKTVTALRNGTGTLVCTASSPNYLSTSMDLTFTAPIVHEALAAGSYFISGCIDSIGNAKGMLDPKTSYEKNPLAITTDYSDDSFAWTVSENENVDDGYNITTVIDETTYYLAATDASQGISVTSTVPAATDCWKISTNGSDSQGNVRYRLSYGSFVNRQMVVYISGETSSYRYYATGGEYNYDFTFIPVNRTLSSLAVSGELVKNVYQVGESFEPDGTALVLGCYTNGYGGDNVYLDLTDTTGWNPATFASAGNATKVYAKISSIQSATYFEVDVIENFISVTGVSLNADQLDFAYEEIGQTCSLVATVTPNDASNKTLTWESSNPAVATVDENGVVTAVAIGSATITVTTVDGGFTDTCAVTVADHVGTHTRLSSTDELWEGRSIIIAAAASNYTMPHWSTGTFIAQSSVQSVTNQARTSLTPGVADAWTVGVYGDYFTFSFVKIVDGNPVTYYLHETTTRNQVNAVPASSFDANCCWSVSIDGNGVATLKAFSKITYNESIDDYYLRYNSQYTRFACYATGQAALSLYAVSADPTDADVLNEFQYKYLHLKDYGTGSDVIAYEANACYGTNGSDGFYAAAKSAYNSLSNARKLLFCTENAYKAGYDRLVAWATACGDAIDPLNNYSLGSGRVAPSISSTSSNDNNAIIIAIIATLGALTVGGLFLASRRRKER